VATFGTQQAMYQVVNNAVSMASCDRSLENAAAAKPPLDGNGVCSYYDVTISDCQRNEYS